MSQAPTGDMAGSQTAASQTGPGEATSSETVTETSAQPVQQASDESTTAAEPSASPSAEETSAETSASSEAGAGSDEAPEQTSESQASESQPSESQPSQSPPGETQASETGTSDQAPSSASIGVTIAVPSQSGEADGDSPPMMELHEQSPTDQQQAALPDTQSQTPPQIRPGFDVVRVEGSGDAVIAGSAHPGAVVTLMDGNVALTSVVADRNGNWVVLTDKPLAPGSYELTLRARHPDGVELESDRAVIVIVPEPPRAVAEGTPQTQPEGQVEDEGPASGDKAVALLVPRRGDGAAEVLQQPEGEGLKDRELVVASVDYDESGRIVIRGRATAGAVIVIFLDGRPIGRTSVGADGRWALSPEGGVTPGLHRLRVDQLDQAGTVVASVATPFSRAEMLTTLPGERFIIVQPGNSLWRIARRTYGEGVRYTVIFSKNRDQIGDPDLIYPGQVFLLPELQ